MTELQQCLQQLDSTSLAAYDGILPALRKIVITTTWEQEMPKTQADEDSDDLHLRFNQYCAEHRSEMGYKPGKKMPITLGDQTKHQGSL